MGRKVRIICTVGTSTLGFQEVADIIARSNLPTLKKYTEAALLKKSDQTPLLEFSQALTLPPNRPDHGARKNALDLLANIPTMSSVAVKKIVDDPDFSTNYNFPSAETQTILRWLHMASQEKDPDKHIKRLHVVLMPSPTPNRKSMITAFAACAYLNRLKRLFPDTKLICNLKNDILSVPVNVDRREDFLESVSTLFKGFDEEILKKEDDEEIVICATGGYKAISGFAMLYAQINSIPCLYSFETSPQAYELMSIPLGYAYAMLDEEINTLKAIKDNINLNLDAMPRWVQDSKELAGVLLKSYDRARKKPYGTGEALFDILRGYGGEGPAWAGYLEDLLIQKWAYLWVGDQIPETVEHSRRHSKRLMEFTANLFRIAPKKMEELGFNRDHPANLAILIAAIYLHDIGHTVLSYPILSKRSSTRDVLPLGLFPSAVREVHHLLTGRLLWSEPERYFKRSNHKNGDDEKARCLGLCVSLVSAYHRGYTSLKDGKSHPNDSIRNIGELLFGKYEFEKTLPPLSERYNSEKGSCTVAPDHILNIAALLRVIDGCDVQADRVISQDYLNYRNQRSEDEAVMLDAQFLSVEELLPSEIVRLLEELRIHGDGESVKRICNELYPRIFWELKELKEQYGSWRVAQRKDMSRFMALSLANRVAFKTEQYLHFKKHQHVGFVLPVLENDIVIVMVFPNKDLKNDSETHILNAVCEDIEGEYKSVKDIIEDKLIFKAKSMG